MKTAITTLGVLTAVVLSLPTLRAEAPLTLKPVWTVGKVYHQTQKMEQTMTLPGMGLQKTHMGMEMSLAVTAEGDEKVVTMTIDSMSMESAVGEIKMTYDSKNKEDAAGPLAMLGTMIGKPFVMIYGADDSFKDVRSFPDLAALGEANPFANKEAVKNLMGESMRAAFPDKPMGVGDTWEKELDMDLGKMGKLKVNMDFKFETMEEVEGVDLAKVKFGGEFSGTIKNDAVPGADVNFGEGSRQDGVMHFDPARGVVVRIETDATMNMEVGDQKIPMKQKVIQSLTSIEDIKE